ncbi:T9SS type A sorting domain-containing protein [Tenacibaculum sp. 190524A02b]|uniref:T9SS type A sorting domain-containing protein n=1 Tax=Tenacibaculum vairaonense TaxID=3137860 RepID=A0ABM9PJP2_9FLAO
MKTKKLKEHANVLNLKSIFAKVSAVLCMLFTGVQLQAQTDITLTPANYGCGATIKLSPNTNNIDVSKATFTWNATGPLLFKDVNAPSNSTGTSSLTIAGTSEVNLVVRGAGKVFVKIIDTSTTPDTVVRYDIDINPTSNQLNPNFTLLYGDINQPNGIQTRSPWIPLNVQSGTSNPTHQVVSITDTVPLNVAWFAFGGIQITSQSTAATPDANGNYVSTVTIASIPGAISKGFLSISFVDACTGVCGGGPSRTWEVLKNFTPSEILGVTCLRDNNLDASKSTAYTVTDAIAGNGLFEWELLDSNGNTFDPAILKIESSELYGNAAAVIYQGNAKPSNVGNFIIRISNTVLGKHSFDRIITASPATPKLSQQIYCADATTGATLEVEVTNPEADKVYTWGTGGNANWTVTPKTTNGSKVEISFTDTESGIITVSAADISEPDCKSSSATAFVNRFGGGNTVAIEGATCIQSNITNDFTFTATPFAKYKWDIPAELTNNGWQRRDNGNTLTLIPPAGGIPANTTGNFTVTATLDGANNCTNPTTPPSASHNFEIAPIAPGITGTICVLPDAAYNYAIDYKGASNAEVTIIDSTGGISSQHITAPANFSFTPTNAHRAYTLKVATYNTAGCESVATSLVVTVQPKATITKGAITCDRQITFTADTQGIADAHQWSYPKEWTPVGPINQQVITLQLDGNAGTVSVTPSNGTCVGSATSLAIAAPSKVTITSSAVLNIGHVVSVSSPEPLIMNWYQASSQSGLDAANCTGGTAYPLNNGQSVTSTSIFATNGLNDWLRLELINPNTGCKRCFVFNAATPPASNTTVAPRLSSGKKVAFKADLAVKTYPNPTSSILNIEVSQQEQVEMIALVNLQGQMVYKNYKASNIEAVEVSKYAKGTYVLYIQNKGSYAIKKVLIK